MDKRICWTIAAICFVVTGIGFAVMKWIGYVGQPQVIAVSLFIYGFIWLLLPDRIRELNHFTRRGSYDPPEGWDDFLAVSAMVVSSFLVFLYLGN